jgi:hypothetical protein
MSTYQCGYMFVLVRAFIHRFIPSSLIRHSSAKTSSLHSLMSVCSVSTTTGDSPGTLKSEEFFTASGTSYPSHHLHIAPIFQDPPLPPFKTARHKTLLAIAMCWPDTVCSVRFDCNFFSARVTDDITRGCSRIGCWGGYLGLRGRK